MKYQAILFDLDGTLLDTLADIATSANRALAHHGFPTHPIDAYRYFVGDGVTNLITRILPESARTPDLIRACTKSYRADYVRNWDATTKPYAGIGEMLDEMIRLKLKLTVLSNKPHESTEVCVRQMLPRWPFDVVLGAGERFAHKPDPAAALHVAESVSLSPSRFLYLGDTATDMKTALAAGMFPVGALWGFRDREELLVSGAKALVAHPRQVLDLLK